MPKKDPIPVYIFTGFLEGWKNPFIKEILADPASRRTGAPRSALWGGHRGGDGQELLRYGTRSSPSNRPAG